ncbi:GEM-like protein 2 isoform X2 [Vicia villosa]|uniref:GEM-like protein 2 isoform X2 n=1 Tax=Vicia villosa TaxID=3911 RepID=UPI00273C38BE|nr:GEM-like protein 2 isoform X2 [Vicia villosa]
MSFNHREIPVTDGTITRTGLQNNSNNPYVQLSPAKTSSAAAANRSNPMDKINGALNTCGKKVEEATKQAESMVGSIWNHVRMSSNPIDTAMARVVQGTKLIANGGSDKLFQQTFGIIQGEKLLKQHVCYISKISGPVIGTLYITNKRLAFCSDYPLCHHPFSLQHQCIYYKVVVMQLDQLRAVSPSANIFNSKEKYIEIVTVDGYEFFFMGFVSYDKALKTLNEVLHQYGNSSSTDKFNCQVF